MKTVGLLTLHGMGDTPGDYARDLVAGLSARLGSAWQRVAFRPVYYQDVVQGKQNEIFARMEERVDWRDLRRFFLFGFSDAATLEHRAAEPDSPYERVQRTIVAALDALYDALGGEERPVVVVAHSLGSQVISNYMWDAQQEQPSRGVWRVPPDDAPAGGGRDRFRRLATMAFLATTGCNIPLFVSGRSRIVPFARPTPQFRWRNFYDKDDVLGWPLRPLYDESPQIVEDVPVNAGGGLIGTVTSSWNPLSHSRYWQDGEVLRPIAEVLADLV